MAKHIILPDWPAPRNVNALITTREGGVSDGAHSTFNLATHVGDKPQAVIANRAKLRSRVGRHISWLNQVHGVDVCQLKSDPEKVYRADASFTKNKESVCAVLTADCLPILVCNQTGTIAATIHAGWRGLCQGVINHCVAALAVNPASLIVYIGPCISRYHFEVEKDVIQSFLDSGWRDLERHYHVDPSKPGKFFLDLVSLTIVNFATLGVTEVYGGNYCTYSDERFYSYRRDGCTGRFASVVWLD